MYKEVTNILDSEYANNLYMLHLRKDPVIAVNKNDTVFPLNAKKFFAISGFSHFEYTETTDVYIHRFGKGVKLPWHRDSKFINQATIYLNPIWHKEWGGLFEQESEDESLPNLIVVPKFNCGVVQDKPCLHRVTEITTDELRLSVQIMQREPS